MSRKVSAPTYKKWDVLHPQIKNGILDPVITKKGCAHLEDALHIMSKTLDDADRPLFDELVHQGNAVADFHNNDDWMKARIIS